MRVENKPSQPPQVRLEELVEDNTEMAGQLREIAMTG